MYGMHEPDLPGLAVIVNRLAREEAVLKGSKMLAAALRNWTNPTRGGRIDPDRHPWGGKK